MTATRITRRQPFVFSATALFPELSLSQSFPTALWRLRGFPHRRILFVYPDLRRVPSLADPGTASQNWGIHPAGQSIECDATCNLFARVPQLFGLLLLLGPAKRTTCCCSPHQTWLPLGPHPNIPPILLSRLPTSSHTTLPPPSSRRDTTSKRYNHQNGRGTNPPHAPARSAVECRPQGPLVPAPA